MTMGRRYRALFTSVFSAIAAIAHGVARLQVNWSIVDASGERAAFRDGRIAELCAFEELRVRLDAEFTADRLALYELHKSARVPIEVVQADHIVAVQPIDVTISEETEEMNHVPPAPIECAFDEAFCIPKIVGIRLPDIGDGAGTTLSMNHSIVLQFATATNRPDARTRGDIEAFVVFPTYVGDEWSGSWTDDKTLVIVVTAVDETRVLPLQPLMNALVHTKLRIPEPDNTPKTARIQADVRLRLEPVGEYTLRLRLATAESDLESPLIRVRSCGDPATEALPLVAVREEDVVSALPNKPAQLPEPSVFIDGVLSHSGTESFTLRHSAIEIEDPGSWSLNFWLFSDEEATGSFRTLFFNGNGTGQHRTASAWFRPDDRRLVLRVSTAANMDVGLDSTNEIPRNEWVNIGVTMTNCSTGVDANATARPDCHAMEKTKPWLYSMKLFVNGVLDQDVRLFSPVLPNNGPLHLAASPWTDGFRGFTSQLRVYGRLLRDADHKTLYTKGRSLYRRYDSAVSCDAMTKAETALHPAQQISFWTQCVGLQDAQSSDSEGTTASSMYDGASQARASCDPSSWDLLVEAAELSDPRALRDVGTAHVYGRLEFADGECVKSKTDGVLVPIDHDKAKTLLLQALSKHEWTAARSLALVQTYNDSSPTHLLSGLYHLAAAAGRKDAFMVLGRHYAVQDKNVKDIAAYYYFHAATDAAVSYHARGKQPRHEMNRLYDGIDHEDELRKGQQGDDDELIQYQKMRADKDGDVEAMANMGDLYYWGARGLERDHEQAYNYFSQAAERGHTNAQSAVAGMLLKGEGTKQDNASAIVWYEKAARKNHTRALNGLGFMHFYGSGGLPENKTLALEFFERAAANHEDGDSIFNAGYCHAFGLGTIRNITRAMEYYDDAARSFGHFDAIHELGKLHWSGWEDEHAAITIPRNSAKTIPYLKAASEAGTWGASVRTGFEFFLSGQYERATVVYAEASEYGYRVAASNLAYLYDQKLLRRGDLASEQRALAHLRRASDKETLVRIGDFYYYGMGGLAVNPVEALRWYSRASAHGVEAGAYNVGHMHEYGLGVPVNFERAERYYKRVLDLAPPHAYDKHIVIQLALVRLRARRWFHGSVIPRTQSDAKIDLPRLPGRQEDPHDAWQALSTMTSIALALVVVSLGAWLVRFRQ